MSEMGWLYDAFDSDPGNIVAFLRWLVERRSLPAEPSVLDIGAGTGRLVAPLTALGWRVTAAEPDPDYRSVLQGVAVGRRVVVLPEAFGTLDCKASFDLALAVNSAFSHVLTPSERLDALRRLHRSLRPGGVLLLDMPNFLWILRNYQSSQPQLRERDGWKIRLLRHHDIDFAAATFTTREEYTLTDSAGVARTELKTHVYAMTALPDLLYLMREAGFDDIQVHDSYASRAVDGGQGNRWLLTGRRGP